MNSKALWVALALLPLGALSAPSAHAANLIKCRMTFELSGWSIIYSTATGHGTVTCNNGESMDVDITAKGGGLTVGKYKLTDGRGTFSHISNINDVLGTYANAHAHAGVVGSSRAAAMTKGDVSLALRGTGKGWDIGAGFSGFTIKKAQQ